MLFGTLQFVRMEGPFESHSTALVFYLYQGGSTNIPPNPVTSAQSSLKTEHYIALEMMFMVRAKVGLTTRSNEIEGRRYRIVVVVTWG